MSDQDYQAVHRLTAFDQVRPEDGHAGWGPLGLIMLQVAVRLVAKLQFAIGLAQRGTQMMQRESPFSRDMLAEITIYIELINALLAAEATARPNRAGVWLPNPHYLNLVRVMGPWWYLGPRRCSSSP